MRYHAIAAAAALVPPLRQLRNSGSGRSGTPTACIQRRNRWLPSTLSPLGAEFIATATLQPVRRNFSARCCINSGFPKLDFSGIVASCDHASRKKKKRQRHWAAAFPVAWEILYWCSDFLHTSCTLYDQKIMYKVQSFHPFIIWQC